MRNGESVTITERALKKALEREIQKGRTYRSVAMDYPPEITCGDIHRIVNRKEFPKLSPIKREAFGLPCLTEVPVCPIHGEAHTVSCPSQRKKRKPPPAMTPQVYEEFRHELDTEQFLYGGLTIDGVLKIIERRYRLVRHK